MKHIVSRWIAVTVLGSTMLFACAGVKKTAKDVGTDLDMREEVVGKPVDENGNPIEKTEKPAEQPAAPAKKSE